MGEATVDGVDNRDYFAINPKPPSLEQYSQLARAFIEQQVAQKRRLALVTSGGTTVPLENQTVRFIDNFSAGTRGATSAEYFIEAGYAVIFLHRQYSLLPYSRHYSHSTNCFLDFMKKDENGSVVVEDRYQQQMAKVLTQYTKAKKANALLILDFTTVNDYLWHLREMAKLMQPLGSKGLFYLAAAVSDFFVPADRMVEHKIQSSEDFNDSGEVDSDGKQPAARMENKSLVIDLDPVPKFLKQLVDGWAPESMIVSFKLETDPSILSKKARYALDKYSHHLVIGNILETRKREVVFVSSINGHEEWIRLPSGSKGSNGATATTAEAEKVTEIESLIIPEVAKMHTKLIEGNVGSKGSH